MKKLAYPVLRTFLALGVLVWRAPWGPWEQVSGGQPMGCWLFRPFAAGLEAGLTLEKL
jgi:hypothetical protein